MSDAIRFVGLDVHKDTIAIAVCEQDGRATSLGVIPNEPDAIARSLRKLGPAAQLRVCYEAGPCGSVVYAQLKRLGIDCIVVAPSLIPMRSGDRVKTDRRDAIKLARCLRNGDLTAVWIPDAAYQALRDLVRARETALEDQKRARNRLQKYLLLQNLRPAPSVRAWSAKYLQWLQEIQLESPAQQYVLRSMMAEVMHQAERLHGLELALEQAVAQSPIPIQQNIAALQSLRGVQLLNAATIVAEGGPLGRFEKAPQLMCYAGLVPSEHSSGGPGGQRRGHITKTGNAHLRRVVVEAAWCYTRTIREGGTVTKRRQGQDPLVVQTAIKAQQRLVSKYRRLVARGVPANRAVTALGREMLGFVWAIARHVQQSQDATLKVAA